MVTDYKEYLLEIIKKDALSFNNTNLSSGIKSNYYIDLRMITLLPESAYSISKILFDMIKDDKIDAVGGMTLGADPIVASLATYSYFESKPVRAFIVRKELKPYGKEKWIEGPLYKNDKVVIVDDVVTSGRSILKTIDIINREITCNIIKIITVVDRLEGGKEYLKKYGYNLVSIFDKNDLLNNK